MRSHNPTGKTAYIATKSKRTKLAYLYSKICEFQVQ